MKPAVSSQRDWLKRLRRPTRGNESFYASKAWISFRQEVRPGLREFVGGRAVTENLQSFTPRACCLPGRNPTRPRRPAPYGQPDTAVSRAELSLKPDEAWQASVLDREEHQGIGRRSLAMRCRSKGGEEGSLCRGNQVRSTREVFQQVRNRGEPYQSGALKP